jgi:hypothetical protein
MRAWRAYVVGKAVLDAQLNRDLQECHQLALGDYELLVRLSEAPCGQARMSTLADQVASSKSRISHQISRMEKAGLVRRQECPGDRRECSRCSRRRVRTSCAVRLLRMSVAFATTWSICCPPRNGSC